MKLSVNLLTWNGEKYIPQLFNSLRAQTFFDWKLYVLDNNSSDKTFEAIKKELNNFQFPYELERNKENKGFAAGHNQLLKKSDLEYVLFLNQDIYLDKNCLKKLADFLDNNDGAGVSPRLLQWDFPNNFTDKIDSLGLKVYKSRRVVDLNENNQTEVFGISGATPMFRRRDLAAVSFSDGSLFDESYGSYKEDVDLAFRLQSGGFKTHIVFDVLAYHDRFSGQDPSVLKNPDAWVGIPTLRLDKKTQPAHIKYNSYKNHLMTIYKNEYWQNFMLDFLWIVWYELKKFIWYLLFDRRILAGLKEIWRERKNLKNKRKEIIKKRRLNWREMRKRIYL